MKKLFIIIALSLFYLNSFGKIEILCDVIYEKTEGEWSDYYRAKVEFLSGQEMDLPTNSNKLFAVIWFSQTNCAIIEMDYNGIILNKVDKNLMFTYLSFDILNEGKFGTQVNGQKSVKWKIYGKDENSLLIDPKFNEYPYDNYNKKTSDNAQNGVFTKRIKPKSQYSGMTKGKVVFVTSQDCYIIQTDKYFVGVKKNTLYYFSGKIDVEDIVFANFNTIGNTTISNSTKETTQHNVIVKCKFDNYQSCYNWLKNNGEL